MSTGRGAAGTGPAAAADLRFGTSRFLAAGLRLITFLFFFTAFLPALFFALAMRSSVRLPRGQCSAAWALLARSRYSTSGSSLILPF